MTTTELARIVVPPETHSWLWDEYEVAVRESGGAVVGQEWCLGYLGPDLLPPPRPKSDDPAELAAWQRACDAANGAAVQYVLPWVEAKAGAVHIEEWDGKRYVRQFTRINPREHECKTIGTGHTIAHALADTVARLSA